MVGSSRANLFDSVSAGISALSGPCMAAPTVEVIRMLQQIHAGHTSVESLISAVKTKEPGKPRTDCPASATASIAMYHPRAKILKRAVDNLLDELKVDDPLLDIARELEERALSDDFFKQARLYPNVDFYSGLLLRAMNIPVNMFTLMFAIGRVAGWVAQWRHRFPEPKAIQMPRQIYLGKNQRVLAV